VETDAIRAVLPLKPGDEFDRIKLKQLLLSVWKMNYFSDVKLDVSPARGQPGRYQLTVLVAEKPAVKEVKLEGNDELSREDFKEAFEVKPFQILDMELVRKTQKKIQEKYIEKGFFLAEVSTRLDPKGNNEVDVVFVINEHAKVTVRQIRFVGNKNVPDQDLRSTMITQEGNLISFMTGAGTYREDAFQRDQIFLQGVYYDRGYINVKIGRPAVELSPDKKFIFITVTVDEGEQYTIGKIDFSGDLLDEKAQLRRLMGIREGDLFSRARLTQDMQVLTDLYKDRGYAYANVSPLTSVDNEKRSVDLAFDISKGNLVHIEKIEMVGNSKTRDKVIRRELRIAEGDLYSSTKLRISKARVTALGFFDNVEINTKRGSNDALMSLEVTVKEKLTGTFQIGFGFTGGESFFGTAQLSQNNLLGYGHTASLAMQISSIRQLFQLSYLDPYVLDTPWTGSVDLYRTELNFSGFDRQSYGGSLTAGYELFEDFRIFATYTIEQVNVVPTSPSGFLLRNQFQSGRTSSVRFSFNYDRRDNRLFPTNGHLESASAEFASSIFGSENLFQRYRLVERFYRPIFGGIVFKANVAFGYIRATDPVGHPIAISERFFPGGINSLRGYPLRSISPTRKVASGTPIACGQKTCVEPDSGLIDFPVGGNKELVTNWEIEFPLVEAAGVRGVVFYDAGNAFDDTENLFSSKQRGGTLPLGLFHSVGFGLRWFSPLGPLRFETGFPLTKRPTDETYLFEFTIGNFF
jgi:outer membrane protein insertion porin family